MEDSGIDSEEKLSGTDLQHEGNECRDANDENGWENERQGGKGLRVTFRSPISGELKPRKEPLSTQANNVVSTCRTLQRKLELKVERAKRNYHQLQEENAKNTKSSNLISIDRLQIPGCTENQPLVDYKSESDDAEEISFFPQKAKFPKKQDLTDTFSIQEMTIESDNSDDSESQNLELLPPSSNNKFLDRLLSCFYCTNGSAM